MKIRYAKNKHQREFDNDLSTKQLFLSSGFGGGKSYGLVMKHLKLSYLNRPFRTGIFVPSVPEYKKDLLPQLEEILEENNVTSHPRFDYNKSDRIWTFPWTQGKCYVFTCAQRIRGPNIACASINEPGLIAYKRYKEILGRVRIKRAPFPQINLAGTWEGRNHWLGDHFLDWEGDEIKRRVIYGSTFDNQENLADDYIETLLENYDDVMKQAYIYGKPVNMNGTMFYFAFTREKNCDKSIKQIPNAPIHITMDFNVGYMTAGMWNLVEIEDGPALITRKRYQPARTHEELHGFDELALKTRDADTKKLCIALKARGYDPATKDITVYPDPAGKSRKTTGKSDLKILDEQGFKKIKYQSKAPGFRDRQNCTNNLFDKGHVKINPDTMKGMLKDFEGVEQDVADFSKLKDNPTMTHFSDGFDYACMIIFRKSGRKPIRSQPMGK